MFNKILLSTAVFFLSACSSVTVTTLKMAAPRPAGCTLDIYAGESEVPRRFETVCLVEAYTGQGIMHDRTVTGAIEQAKPKLCGCGAEAAILVGGSSQNVSWILSNAWTNNADLRGNAVLKGVRFLE